MTVENPQADAASTTPTTPPPPDRGDVVTPPAAEAKPEVAEKPAAEVVTENPVEKKADETTDEGRARNADGTFAKKEEILIPKSRFDEAGQKARTRIAAAEERTAALEREIAARDSGDTAELENQIAEKTAEHSKLLEDGKIDEATKLMTDILRINRTLSNLDSGRTTARATADAVKATSFEELLDVAIQEFPVFNSNHAAYDEKVVNWTNAKMQKFMKAGDSQAAALSEAVELAVSVFDLKPASAVATPAKAADPKATAEAQRKVAGVAAAVAAAAAQPAKLDVTGMDSDKGGAAALDVSKLSYTEFTKLPDAVVRRMRGDDL